MHPSTISLAEHPSNLFPLRLLTLILDSIVGQRGDDVFLGAAKFCDECRHGYRVRERRVYLLLCVAGRGVAGVRIKMPHSAAPNEAFQFW